jgi:hypothetical protein
LAIAFERATDPTVPTLQEIHGDGNCHICGKPKAGEGENICSYPHGMMSDKAVDAEHPEGFWTWKMPEATNEK